MSGATPLLPPRVSMLCKKMQSNSYITMDYCSLPKFKTVLLDNIYTIYTPLFYDVFPFFSMILCHPSTLLSTLWFPFSMNTVQPLPHTSTNSKYAR